MNSLYWQDDIQLNLRFHLKLLLETLATLEATFHREFPGLFPCRHLMTIYQFFLEDLISQLPQKQSVLMEKALLGSTYMYCVAICVYVCIHTYLASSCK